VGIEFIVNELSRHPVPLLVRELTTMIGYLIERGEYSGCAVYRSRNARTIWSDSGLIK
jgi:hypothetical protein